MDKLFEIIIEFIVVISLIILMILFGISVSKNLSNHKNEITEGEVISKDYQAAYTTVTYINSGDALLPITNYYPEIFTLTIRGDKNGETVEYWFKVSENEYEKYNIGDYYKE